MNTQLLTSTSALHLSSVHSPFVAGLSSVSSFLESCCFTQSDIDYISEVIPCESSFLDYLQTLNTKKVRVHALEEVKLAVMEVPGDMAMLRVTGPLVMLQPLETPLLNLVKY